MPKSSHRTIRSIPQIHRFGQSLDFGSIIGRIDFDQHLRQLAEHIDVLSVLVELRMECLQNNTQ